MSNDPIMRLSLSNNATLEYVLSDIPFFCVGLTALAVFSFFIVMRRINLPAVYLYTSSLLAFVSAILDLSQILFRGVDNTDRGLELDAVTGLIDAREVGFALAFAFRFLYLWAFVAQRPRYEPRSKTPAGPFAEPLHHSASWERWGALGFILKFGLLGSIFSIPILQILWRIVTGMSSVYIAESTLQIAVSALLIAKLMLNLFLTNVAPWYRPFLPYLIPIVALMISTGIGAGNLLVFRFSETTLGRFLQAVETYALILNALIYTFYNVPRYVDPATVKSDPRKRSSFFTDIKGKMDAPPFQMAMAEPEVVEEPVIQIGRAVTTPSSRESAVSRISSWINARRPPPRPSSAEQKLWSAGGDAELGIATEVRSVTPEVAGAAVTPSPRIVVEPTQRATEENTRQPLTVNTLDSQSLAPNSTEATTPSTTRPFTGVSFSSYYGMATSSRLTMPGFAAVDDARATDSPVYGLNGIVGPAPAAEPESPILARRPPSASLAPSSPSLERESVNSFDELLRQQTELDKSIAALRLFSPTSTVTSLPPPPQPDVKILPPEGSRSLSMSSGKSVSARSDFSLSNFPEPPPVDRSTVLDASPLGRGREQPFPSRARIPQSAVSTNADDDLSTPVQMRFDSQITQYDVTSFIGDLTNPSNDQRKGTLDEVTEKPEMEYSDVESPVTTAASSNVNLRPLLLSPTTSPLTTLPAAAASSGTLPTLSTIQPGSNYEYPVLKPLLLGSAGPTPAVRRPAGASARRPSRAGRDGRPNISGPRPQEEDTVDEAFERPRRPPVYIPDNIQ
ncbi:hypothetical protein R3P38DRAFT_3249592 [Favolaschia claudopus]|uniref:Uncharacterized protein n=1 Tax=Favolaschia claudopus TaxID=2862362 RepID=A0AAW0EI36_9AGAR